MRETQIDVEDGQLRLATALAAAETADAVTDAVASWGASASHAAFANMAIFDAASNSVGVVHADSLDSSIGRRWERFPLETPTPLCDAILTGEPVLLRSLADYAGRYQMLASDTAASGLQATASLPLKDSSGSSIGAVGFAWELPRDLTPRQLVRLHLIAALTAQALERVGRSGPTRVGVGRATARALQEAFLPSVPLSTPELQTAAAYLPANDSAMGGDWFDVFPVDTGVCLVVGDIGGHGADAAALMAEMRSAVRAYAIDEPDPAAVTRRANTLLCRLHPEATATMVVSVFDPPSATFHYCNAGHPPILRCRRGEFGFLEPESRSPLLGSSPDWPYRVDTKALRPGTTLLLYTDGLVERAWEAIDSEMAELLAHLDGLADLSPDSVVESSLLWRVSRGPCEDDICVLAVRLR